MNNWARLGHRGFNLWICFVSLTLLVTVGCQSSGIASRRKAHAAAYSALSPAEKALVDRGEIREGLSTNAVLIAWGEPQDVGSIRTPNGPYVIWNYSRKQPAQPIRRTAPAVVGEPRGNVSHSQQVAAESRYEFENSNPPVEVVYRTAVFHDGKVVSWKAEP